MARGLLAALCLFACGTDLPPADITVVDVAGRPELSGAFDSWTGFGGLDGSAGLGGLRVLPAVPTNGGRVRASFSAEGLDGITAEVGLLPSRAAATQEVGHGQPPQPDDPRALWERVILKEGENVVEFSIPLSWQARGAVVVAELRGEGRRLSAISGPRSEMIRGGRLSGGRAVLGLIDVETSPVSAVASRVGTGEIVIDGELDEPVWASPGDVLHMATDGEPQYGMDISALTHVWFAYDDASLYVAATLPDRDIYSKFSEHDDPLWTQEALELFISGEANGRDYLEYQVTARNVTFDAHFPRYRKGDEGFDSRWETAVRVQGTVNRRRDRDRGWTVEARIPWSEICERTDAACPMARGSTLRLNVVRVERVGRKSVVALTLSPLRSSDFHAWDNAARLTLD